VLDDNFDILFRRQGFREFTYQSEMQPDLQLLKQRWNHPPRGGTYLANEFYKRFGQNTFRKLLGRIYTTPDGVSRESLAQNCSNSATLDEHLTFMCDQELAVEDGGMVYKGPNWQHVSDLGRTLEWYVAWWFQTFLKCPARYGVRVPSIADGGDLDVVAFMDGLRIWVECKSGRDITDRQLQLFLQRAEEFTPVLAVLLIDTEDKRLMERCMDSLDRPYPHDSHFQLKNEREWLFWRGRGLYVVAVRHSIEESLLAVMRLYHDYVRFVPFVG
jgi:hypothetical protein